MTVYNYVLTRAAASAFNQNCVLSLHTNDPGTSGGSNEVSTSGTGYSRKSLTAGNFGTTGNVRHLNPAQDFGDPTATWGTVSHWLIRNGTTTSPSDHMASGEFQTAASITAATTNVTVQANSISVTFSSS